MFNDLYQRPFTLARKRSGPLLPERRSYLRNRAQQQMSERTMREVEVANYLLEIAPYLCSAASCRARGVPALLPRCRSDLWNLSKFQSRARRIDLEEPRRFPTRLPARDQRPVDMILNRAL